MRKIFCLFGLSMTLLTVASGCVGPRVEIPTAHVGKIMSSSGLEENARGPSTFRLPYNFLGLVPTELLLVEASDQQKQEKMSLFMPKDKLVMDFDVRGTFSISSDKELVNKIYSRLTPTETGSYSSIIDFDAVYETYGQQIVVTVTRAVLVKYQIEYVMAHREKISLELETEVRKRLATTPLMVDHFGLSGVQPPQLIINAQRAAKEREVQIEQAKADRLVKLTEADANLEVARKQQMVDLLEADTQRQVGLSLTRGVNRAFVQQRVITVLDKLANSTDKIIIVPEEAFANPSMMMAVNQKALSSDSVKTSSVKSGPTK